MTAPDPSSDADPLVALAEEFADRYRRGDRPPLAEYTDRYPDLADRIRKLFPAMVVMEAFGSVAGPAPGPAGGGGAPPRQLGEYRILREVGRGGMGVVYEAVQESLGRHVALKVLPAHTRMSPTQVERFRREARAVARLHHTNIVPVFGVGEADGVHYYAMQFIHGQSLDSVLEELKVLRRAVPGGPPDAPHLVSGKPRPALSASIAQGLITGEFPQAAAPTGPFLPGPPAGAPTAPFVARGGESAPGPPGHGRELPAGAGNRSELTGRPDAEYARGVARAGVQVADALAYAHAQGVLHRDIKPANLLLDTHGAVWVTDFGLAKADDGGGLTGDGDIVGTVRYMAPERFRGEADPRSDVYGLGLTLYEMLTLRPAFGDADRPRLMEHIARRNPTPPRAVDPRIPRDLELVVLKATAKDPADRYPTAAAMAEDLGRFLTDRPILARRTTRAEHCWRWCRRNPAVAGLLAAVAVLLVGLVVVLAVSNARIGGALAQQAEALGKEKQAKLDAERAQEGLVQTLYYQWVAAAADARDKKLAARAEEFLDRCPPGLRGWEWCYLKRLPFASFPPLEHGDEIVLRVAYSPDGRLLAAGSRNGSVSVWDARTGKAVLRPFQAQKEFVRGLAFSPDGRYLATGGQDDRVRLWDTRTGVPDRDFPTGRPVVLLALAFSPDGRQLAASDQDRTIRVWDTATRTETLLAAADPLAIAGLEFSADGRQLLAVSTEGVVTAWDVAARSPAPVFDAGLTGVRVVAFSPDRKVIALGAEDGSVKVLRADPWRVVWTLEAHTGPLFGLAFGAGGDRLATVAGDMTLRVWDMRTGQEALSADFAAYRWNAVAFSPDGRRLAAGNVQGTVHVLDGSPPDGGVAAGPARTLEGHRHMVAWVAYSPDGGRIASASWDGTAKIWDAGSGQVLQPMRAGDSPLTGVAFSPDGRRVAASSWGGNVRVWDADTGAEVFPPLRGQAGPVYGVAFSPDGRALVSAHHDGALRVWDADTGRQRRVVPAHPHPVLGLAFSRDGGFLASAGGKAHSARVWAWGPESPEPVLTLNELQGILRSPAFSPDGRRVAAVTGGMRAVWLWDTTPGGKTERPAKEYPIPGVGAVNMAVFHPDGRRLVVVSDDQVQLLDPETGGVATVPVGHAGAVGCAAFSPDGRFLATGAGYRGRGEIRIWEASRCEKNP